MAIEAKAEGKTKESNGNAETTTMKELSQVFEVLDTNPVRADKAQKAESTSGRRFICISYA